MTIDPISLSELKAKRAAMDRGPWSFDTPEPPAGSVDVQGAECRCDDVDDTADPPAAVMCPKHEHVAEWVTLPNATGIVATHNTADVLIELAEALLGCRDAFSMVDVLAARERLDVALSKVKP